MSHSPFSEPTQLAQIFGSYKTQVKRSMNQRDSSLGSFGGRSSIGGRSTAEHPPLATRLMFDDTLEVFHDTLEVFHQPKVPRLNPDPFDSISGRKRFSSENNSAVARLEEENRQLAEKVKQYTAESAGDLARYTRLETRFNQAELAYKKEKLEWEHKMEKVMRLYKTEVEKSSELTHRLKKVQETRGDKQERSEERRRESLDKVEVLENKVRLLRESKTKLEDQVGKLQTQLNNRVDMDPFTYSNKMQAYKCEVEELRHLVKEQQDRNKALEGKARDHAALLLLHQKTKEDLMRSRNRVEKLESELEANREAVLQRRAMHEKLERFSLLERENNSLRSRNDLLIQTQANIALLNEKILSLTAERDRAESKCRDRDSIRAELETARQELRSWLDLIVGIAPAELRPSLAEFSIQTARELIHSFQSRELGLVNLNSTLKIELAEQKVRLERGEERLKETELALSRVKEEQAEQARLVKKLQRKLVLVTRERDTSKAILDSVEKEMTLSGNQWEQERIMGLEKTLEEHKAMLNMLLEEGGVSAPAQIVSSGKEGEKLRLELVQLQGNYTHLQAKCESLELELERRAIKGDFDPVDTKVIHFLRNPARLAGERKESESSDLQAENHALKARVKLLEEGQTKDLTIMVGQRLEEGASGTEVLELKEQLKSSNMKNQRIMEAFQKTSKEFREFVMLTTGYRIDRFGEDKYRIHPVYADSNQYLLFQRTPEEPHVHMLESEYSLELSELMELHLEQHNSIPMFLAGLTMDLFGKQQVEDEEYEEEEDNRPIEDEVQEEEDDEEADHDGEDENDEQQDMEEDDGRSQDSGDSSDFICVEEE